MASSGGKRLLAVTIGALTLSAAQVAKAELVVYQDLPTNDSQKQSFHNANGPILADDFVPSQGGFISRVDWWGTAAQSDQWELAFHTDDPNTHQPNLDDVTIGSLKKVFVTAVGTAEPGLPAGLLHYSATGDFINVAGGTEYWLTVANSAAGWNWADALNGPTIGSENYNAHTATGPLALDGGPHGGPWTDVHTDLAFSLSVPDGGMTAALLALALGSMSFLPIRKMSAR